MDHEHEIRERAYEIWLAAGQPDDKAMEHWAQAEQEIGAEAQPGVGGASPALGSINEADD